jgi:hypothetical protein
MSSPTAQAMYSINSTQQGTTLATAFPQVSPNGVGNQNLDLIQIVDFGGLVVLNVDYQGNVHNPAVSATNGTRIGQFLTRLASGSSTANFFADAFSNPSQQDIIQAANIGQNIHYNLNYLGVSSGS